MNAAQSNNTFAPWLQKLQNLQDGGFKPIVDQLQQTAQKLTNTTGPAFKVTPPPEPGVVNGKGWGQQWQWIKDGFTKNFINGKGRASRMEYWCIAVVVAIIGVIGFVGRL